MKEMVRYGFTLALICTMASASLALVNSLTKPKIIAQEAKEEEASLFELLPEASRFDPIKSGNEIAYYKGYDKDSRFVGAVFKASQKGYSSVIQTMAAMAKDGKVLTIKVVSQNETPGLGARVNEPDFALRFAGRDVEGLIQVQAITGATISSKAVIDSVAQKAKEIKELIKNEP